MTLDGDDKLKLKSHPRTRTRKCEEYKPLNNVLDQMTASITSNNRCPGINVSAVFLIASRYFNLTHLQSLFMITLNKRLY